MCSDTRTHHFVWLRESPKFEVEIFLAQSLLE